MEIKNNFLKIQKNVKQYYNNQKKPKINLNKWFKIWNKYWKEV